MIATEPTSAQKIAIIDLGAGNLRSVHKAVERASISAGMAATVQVTTNPDDLDAADRIVLPGVGAFAACMTGLNRLQGMRGRLEARVIGDKVPLLGICVGMQMLADYGHEFGKHEGLGWISGDVNALPAERHLRIPHMGWNQVQTYKNHDLFGVRNELSGKEFYFLHSYYFETEINHESIAFCRYDEAVTAMVSRDNIVGTQFHPEKSQGAGLAMLENFLRWIP